LVDNYVVIRLFCSYLRRGNFNREKIEKPPLQAV
jgi:hypothetical protein